MIYFIIFSICLTLITSFYIPDIWMITAIMIGLVLIEVYFNKKSEKYIKKAKLKEKENSFIF